jgi:putative Ca2+/H+ antiporter (TMEM165/GDT1 family)
MFPLHLASYRPRRRRRYASATDSFLQSFGAILVSEIGDKTFFIAALLAMKSSPHVVFAGAIGALAFMTVLSVVLGYAAPLLLPREITHYAAVALFFFFGCVSHKPNRFCVCICLKLARVGGRP